MIISGKDKFVEAPIFEPPKAAKEYDTYITYPAWGPVHEYFYLSTFKYTFDSTCTLLKHFLIPAGILVLILNYQM